MQREFSTYMIYFLIITIAGCSGMSVQSPRNQSGLNSGAHVKSSRSHIVDVYETEPDDLLPAEDDAKVRTKAYKGRIYRLDTSDILQITVFEEPDLSIKLKVAEDGIIVYPLIGKIKVKGLTIQDAERALEKQLRDGGFLKNPQATIELDLESMKLFSDKEVFVMGEVRNPGAIAILGKNITVLEAIAKASGFTDYAAPNRTIIIRIENGVENTIMVDLNKVKKGDKSLDIILKQGDVVVVPETFF